MRDTADIIRYAREQAASHGALRTSAPAAIALDAAADRLEELLKASTQPPEKHTPAKPPFVVWSPDGETPPKIAHTTHKSAHRAAHLLAERHEGRTFFVMARSGRPIAKGRAAEVTG